MLWRPSRWSSRVWQSIGNEFTHNDRKKKPWRRRIKENAGEEMWSFAETNRVRWIQRTLDQGAKMQIKFWKDVMKISSLVSFSSMSSQSTYRRCFKNQFSMDIKNLFERFRVTNEYYDCSTSLWRPSQLPTQIKVQRNTCQVFAEIDAYNEGEWCDVARPYRFV